MIDDNTFNDDRDRPKYEVCSFCGSIHAADEPCITLLVAAKTKMVWMCDQIKNKIGVILGLF